MGGEEVIVKFNKEDWERCQTSMRHYLKQLDNIKKLKQKKKMEQGKTPSKKGRKGYSTIQFEILSENNLSTRLEIISL